MAGRGLTACPLDDGCAVCREAPPEATSALSKPTTTAPADGGGGRARERGAGLGGAQLAARPLVAGQGDAGYGTVLYYSLLPSTPPEY